MISDDLIQAYHACLNPECADAPSSIQKAMVMADIGKLCFMRKSTFIAGQTPHEMAVHEGMRNAALAIHERSGRDPFIQRQPKAHR